MPIFRRTVTARRPRQWYAPSKAGGPVTFTPSSAVSTWVVGAATLAVGALSLAPSPAVSSWIVPTATLSVGAVALAPSAAIATWTVPTATLAAGALTLSPVSAISTWTVGAASFAPGALTLAPASATSAWTVGSAALSSGLILTTSSAVATWTAGTATLSAGPVAIAAPSAVSTWQAGAPTLGAGALALSSASGVSTWVVGAATFGPSVPVNLIRGPLYIDFPDLRTSIDFTDLRTLIVWLSPEGDEIMGPLKLFEGEVVDVPMILRGAGGVVQDLTGNTSITWTVGELEDDPVVDDAPLSVVGAATAGTVKYPANPELALIGGRYKSLAVVTFPGSPPIVRKFPGEVLIESAIA